MTQQSFRGVVSAAIAIVLVAGLYLGWHFTHRPNPACQYQGQTIHGFERCP